MSVQPHAMNIMKRITSILFFSAIAFLLTATTSCGNSKKNSEENNEMLEPERPEEQENTLYSLNPFHVSDSVRANGHLYVYTIDRSVLDSVVVVDEDGNRSQDNSIRLTVTCDGTTYFQKQFTRSAFHIHVPDSYYQQCILLGMNFDRVTEYGLRFQASIGKGADSEDYKPYSLTVGNDGSTNITEHDLYEDDEVTRFEDEGV